MAVFKIDRFRPSPGAADALRARIAPLFSARRGAKAVDPRLIRIIEVALVIAMGAVLASIFWSLFGPVSRPSTTPRASAAPVELAPLRPVDPFRMAAAAEAAPPETELGVGPDLAVTTLNLVLHGTWITQEGGAAFIKTPDEKQGRYSIGDTITSGVTLERVYRDQVVISRGGVRESLKLINREQTAPPSRTPSPAADSKIASDVSGLASIGNLIVAQPQLDNVGNVSLILQPSGDPAAFEELGLRPGDRLVAVNNLPFGSDIAANLETIARLGGKGNVTLSVDRDGIVMPITIALPDTAGAPND